MHLLSFKPFDRNGMLMSFGKCHLQLTETRLPLPRQHVQILVQMFWPNLCVNVCRRLEIPPCRPSMLYIHLIIDATRTSLVLLQALL